MKYSGTAIKALERGETVSIEDRLEAAKSLLEEVVSWHADQESPDYNECDTSPCHFCDMAKLVMEAP